MNLRLSMEFLHKEREETAPFACGASDENAALLCNLPRLPDCVYKRLDF